MKLEKEKTGLERCFMPDIFGELYYDSGILSDFQPVHKSEKRAILTWGFLI
ncbi:hypothetical protein CLSA_c29580 [Clostridium saccharobutylicum DSM 13864]|uniref:Uncharacterized protein n=2 Tax=Clostridium saccharobutylicum TaxID=169679 RepID=U5MWQ2_CLOSA|nr:hypothetical protein CLSA_c29000 [Clostridium saccharobutylicum DSM 13864]AGX43925.1 hypothetical protein CLSA_c29580 [Clostridium saccharobutylicum DSM 13864]